MAAASADHFASFPLYPALATLGIPRFLTTVSKLHRRANGEVVARSMVGHASGSVAMTLLYSDVDREERLEAQKAAFGSWLGGTAAVGPT
jgi:hypothetical protein